MNVSKRNAVASYSMPRVLRRKLDERDLWDPLNTLAQRNCTTLAECFSVSRKRHIVRARHAMWRWLSDELGWSSVSIGDLFGMDHTTVLYALKAEAA